LLLRPVLSVTDAAAFTPPSSGTVVRPFEAQHWHVRELLLADPDGRALSVQAPLVGEQVPHG
jgi:hypothetical protein